MSKETISIVERVAQAVVDAIIAQDAIASPVTLEDGTIAYLDQGVTDMRLVAIAAIKAMSDVAPVAWLYLKPENGKTYNYDKLLREHRCPACVIEGWTEIPLRAMIDAALSQE